MGHLIVSLLFVSIFLPIAPARLPTTWSQESSHSVTGRAKVHGLTLYAIADVCCKQGEGGQHDQHSHGSFQGARLLRVLQVV